MSGRVSGRAKHDQREKASAPKVSQKTRSSGLPVNSHPVAAAVALEQGMTARVEEMRARVVEAEAEVPRAMAEAFRAGNMGMMG